jgi:glycosyltransferase involved in cell wall biosynthesis
MIRGGADENTYATIVGLNGGRYDMDLLAGANSELDNFPLLSGKKIFIVEDLVRDISPWKDFSAFWQIYRFLKKNRYDVVHTHTAKGGFIGRISARMANVPIVIHTLHGTTFGDFLPYYRKKLYVSLEKMAALSTDKFISVGRDVKSIYLNEGIGDPGKHTVIYSGIDIDRFHEAGRMPEERRAELRNELGLEPSDTVIVNISRLEPRKGLKFFLESASKIVKHYPHTKFLVVGEGSYRAELKRRSAELNLSSNLKFTGPRRDIENVIGISDISVLTSLWEGLPRVLIQSALVGKPIVTFEVEGAREVVENGVNGFVVPSKDVDTLTERIEFLLEEPKRARKMGLQGREIVGDAWRVEKMVDRIDEVYSELIEMKLRR